MGRGEEAGAETTPTVRPNAQGVEEDSGGCHAARARMSTRVGHGYDGPEIFSELKEIMQATMKTLSSLDVRMMSGDTISLSRAKEVPSTTPVPL